jgi:glucose/arabinose dehydrogenase
MYETPNGDILVAESNTEVSLLENAGAAIAGITKADKVNSSANRITLLRDADGDGKPEIRKTFAENLSKPFGMLVLNNQLYVANTNAIVRFNYHPGDLTISDKPETIVNLPGLGRHWTKNIVANADGSKIYIAVGSSTNVAENGIDKEINRANILEMNPDGTALHVFASGLRNPVGMAWAPGTKTLWAAVNERDELGDDLVPDYLTSVKENGFYGWPWAYIGRHTDPRVQPANPEMVAKAIVPDVLLGSHTASLGLVFYTKNQFPSLYHNGAFVAQHGSWNRSKLAGYKVLFVPFKNGKPSGKPQEFLSGFIAGENDNKVYGRPTGLLVLKDGSMLLTDDKSNRIWRISYSK